MSASQAVEEALFNAARQIGDAVARAQYLREAAGGDEALLRRVEALLAVYDTPDRLLDQPAVAAVPTQALTPMRGDEPAAVISAESAGSQIGPYKLLQQIGEGGMGTVFMAEQTHPVQRKVALKVIKAGMDSRQVIARFEAERQALAMMDHVNIARVFDAGATESGRPYFVMELVRGIPITKYCDDNHLTPRQRLELFVPVCQAIQHAHQKGIIHRDIKPSNVMITLYDAKPVPKVIDFGVAKATEQKLTERTLFTQYGTPVGTLEYMSPEQAEMSALGVDTRSDIFSLGVLLYELLTGSTPISHKRVREAAYGEILRMIKEEEPPRPSTRLSDSGEALASISAQRHMEPARLTKLVRGELDWIVMKTLEKDRNRRYETASGLAMDLQRYLADEPVQACPPSSAYRFRKFARRNRTILLTVALVAVVLLVGAVVSVWQAVRATEAEGLAQTRLGEVTQERNRADEEKARAEANLRKAREVVDRMFTRVAQDLAHTPRMEKVRRALLVDALEFYQGFLKENGTNPTLRYEAALAYIKVGEIHGVLGQFDLAEEAWRQAIALLEKLSAQFPQVPEYRENLAYCFGELGLALSRRDRLQQGIEERRTEVDLREKLASDFPTVPDYRRKLAIAHTDLGNVFWPEERLQEAEHHYRQALFHWEKLRADFPEVPEDRKGLAHIHHWWGNLLFKTNRLQEAEQEFRKVLALRERLLADEPGNSELKSLLAHIQDYLGQVLLRRRKLAGEVLGQRLVGEAEDLFRRSVRLYETLTEDFPDTPDHRRRLMHVYGHLSDPLMQMGRVEEAIGALRRSISEEEKLIANSYLGAAQGIGGGWGYYQLGFWLKADGRVQEAADAFREAKARFEKQAAQNPHLPYALRELAYFLTTCPATQFRDVNRAITLAKQVLQFAPLWSESWYTLGLAEYRAGHWVAAIEALDRSAKEGWAVGPEAAFFRAIAHWQVDHKKEARQWYDQAVGLIERVNASNEDLRRLRAEAAKLLGLPEPSAPGKEAPRPTKG